MYRVPAVGRARFAADSAFLHTTPETLGKPQTQCSSVWVRKIGGNPCVCVCVQVFVQHVQGTPKFILQLPDYTAVMFPHYPMTWL